MTADRLTYSAIGRALGITKQAVGKAVKAGMPVDSIEAAAAWRAANLDAARAKDVRLSMQTPAPAGAGTDAPAAPEADATDESSAAYRADRARHERIKADTAQLELDRLRGSLVDRDEVARLRFTEFRGLRDALGNVGARIKDQLAVETDPLKCEVLVNDELAAVLSAFAAQVLTRGVTQDADDDGEDDDAAA